MDAKVFLAEFGHIASAPSGVQHLRGMIRSLAVAGDLAVSDSSVDARPLLESILQQKNCHPDAKKVVAPQSPLSVVEKVRAPTHWAQCRLGDLVLTITGGGTPSKSNPSYWRGDIPWASVKDLKGTKYLEKTEDRITREGLVGSSTNLIPPGRVIVCTRMGLGKLAITKYETAINQDLKALELPPEVNVDFFCLLYSTLNIQGTGTTVSGITQDKLLAYPTALPPMDEQKYIVAKVDELIALCDKLETHHLAKEKLSLKTRAVVLDALTKAKDSSALRHAWTRTTDNWRNLLNDEQGQDFLRDAVSALAVRGLISGWSGERSRSEEIKAACTELKQRYIDDGWLRRQKPIGMARSASAAYPPHWAVVPFDEVAIVIGGVTKGRDLKGRNARFFPYLRVANVQRGFFDLDEMKQIEILVDEFDKYRVEVGDLLITEGGDWDKVGRTAIWKGGVSECLHQNHVFKARIPSGLLMAEWVELVFNSAIGRNYFAGASKQTTNLASINMSQLRSFPFPVPPLPEQIDILAKVIALTGTCTALKERWSTANRIARDLVTASVMAITGIRIEEREEMKAPKTELVSRLSLGVSPADKDQAPLAALLMRNKGELSAKALWQASGLEIDEFYRQLKTEMARGWIVQPEVAYVREVAAG